MGEKQSQAFPLSFNPSLTVISKVLASPPTAGCFWRASWMNVWDWVRSSF